MKKHRFGTFIPIIPHVIPLFLLVKDSPSIRGIGKWLYHQVKERREKRNSRNHLFRDYGSKGRGREAHPEFLVVWVVQTCRGVVKTFFEVVFSSDINTTFTTRSCHRKGTFLCLQR